MILERLIEIPNGETKPRKMAPDERRLVEFELAILAYSCHCKARQELEELFASAEEFQRDGIRKFCFYEYFCREPIERREHDGDYPTVGIYVPFTERILRDHPYVVHPAADVPFPDDPEYFPNMQRVLRKDICRPIEYDSIEKTIFGSKAFGEWKEQMQDPEDLNAQKQMLEADEIFRRDRYDYLRRQIAGCEDENTRRQLIREYYLAGHHFWYLSTHNDCSVVYTLFPIASRRFFYGYIISGFPLAPDDTRCTGDNADVKDKKYREIWKKRMALAHRIRACASECYVPVLRLFFNSISERQHDEKLKELKKTILDRANDRDVVDDALQEARAKAKTHVVESAEHGQLEPIERGISAIWSARADFMGRIAIPTSSIRKVTGTIAANVRQEVAKKIEHLRESLIFRKFVVGSPAMSNAVKSVFNADLNKGEEDELPTALVIGEPGSGKEKLARLISYMSTDYFAAKTVVINMASLKPREIAPLLISGLSLAVKPNTIRVEGVFSSALEKSKTDEGDAEDEKKRLVFILDELNSLDVDSQGALLRIIENGELQPLGLTEHTKVDFAIIGVMNEAPDQLTMTKTLGEFRKSKSLLGELPYLLVDELLKRLRRLRPDLHYRMRRGGEISLSSLNHRREDIPVLFFLFLQRELWKKYCHQTETMKSVTLEIEMEALDELIHPEILWPGSVRSLQYITKRILSSVGVGGMETGQYWIRISGSHVHDVLDELRGEETRERISAISQ